MTAFPASTTRLPIVCLTLLGLTLALMLPGISLAQDKKAENEVKLLVMERPPFDRIVLKGGGKGSVVDVKLLDLPARRVPNPLPTTGTLEVFQLSQPSIPYRAPWNKIGRVLLYEQMILEEAVQLRRAKKTLDAFRSLQFLHKHYPELPGLNQESERFLRNEAAAVFNQGQYEDALAVLLTLYEMNPDYQGLGTMVDSVSQKVITALLKQRDFAGARGALEMLKQSFPQLELANVATWEQRFEQGAAKQLEEARQALQQEDFDKARAAVRAAIGILPGVPGAQQLVEEIDRRAPRTVIAVHRHVASGLARRELTWAEARVSQLVAPQFIQMVDFGTEGGIYKSRWAELNSDDTGTEYEIGLSPLALGQGFSPERLALSLLAASDPQTAQYESDFANAFNFVTISAGEQATIHWHRPHVRPEALLRMPVAEVVAAETAPGVYVGSVEPKNPIDMRYELASTGASGSRPRQVIERVHESIDEAMAFLRSGQIDVIDHLAPWEADQLKSYANVQVESYRLPTVHVLRMNYENPLLKSREFRRALCYGIDRNRIVDDVLLAGSNRLGFRVLSGPMPSGTSYTDPIAYAYNQQLQPRPYEPRLASVLATVARTALAKRNAKVSEQDEQPEAEPTEEEEEKKEPKKPILPLRLAHPPSDLARSCCQTIQLQLNAVGIPIELVELPSVGGEMPENIDLTYTQLAIREPLVDARRLLGPEGLAGICSSSMNVALGNVDKAKNWRETTERLLEVHQIAYYDLPVIPLWQTLDSFAYHKSLRGIGKKPVSLYQNVTQWQTVQAGGGR